MRLVLSELANVAEKNRRLEVPLDVSLLERFDLAGEHRFELKVDTTLAESFLGLGEGDDWCFGSAAK